MTVPLQSRPLQPSSDHMLGKDRTMRKRTKQNGKRFMQEPSSDPGLDTLLWDCKDLTAGVRLWGSTCLGAEGAEQGRR